VQKTTRDITYYVDATNGNDNTNDGLTNVTAFKTITKAINMIPQIVNHGVHINVASGTYSEIVWIGGFFGSGAIYLNGGTDLTTTVNYKVNAIYVAKNSCPINVTGFQSIATTGINAGFWVSCSTNVFIRYCLDTITASKNGFAAEYSNVYIASCQLSNKTIAILAYINSAIYSENNTGNGNTTGLQSISGTLMKNATQPSGTTAEFIDKGGVIR